MPKILGIRIQRYRSLADITLGRIKPSDKKSADLTPLVCLIGPNGSGKSTLLDAFGFIADCLRRGVEEACNAPHRGGFRRLRTQGASGPIEFEILYRETEEERPIRYKLAIEEREGTPVAVMEELWQGRRGKAFGRLYPFVKIRNGSGEAWAGESTKDAEGSKKEPVNLADLRQLAITTLGNVKEHPRILKLRQYIESWYLSYFVPDAARSIPAAGPQPYLSRSGDNLANVVEYMERKEPDRFRATLDQIARRIPGITKIKPKRSADDRLLLEFNEAGYKDPFYQYNMSDGTLKIFSYLLLLASPQPRPFIGIEEPENGLYHKLVEKLAEELKAHAIERDTQVLVTTHSPYFVDALRPEEVWLMQRDESGSAHVKRAADMNKVKDLVEEGISLGSLWYSQHFEERVRL